MAKAYVLYNPLAGNGHCKKFLEQLKNMLTDEAVFCDMTKDGTYEKLFYEPTDDDYIILCGGDGTLNRFINLTDEVEIDREILYFPTGSGNDFAHDLGKHSGDAPFSITEYIKDLPLVEVNNKKYRFINGIGYGIDGYCCMVGDEIRKKSDKAVNYTSIAIKGLLFHYKPTNACITVDGNVHMYNKVWLAPTMNGRFYGVGMMPAPNQKRNNSNGELSVMVMHGSGKLKTLMIFPSIFKGEHINHEKTVKILKGHEIKVEFDSPTALQIDGETILNVTSYKAYYPKHVYNNATVMAQRA